MISFDSNTLAFFALLKAWLWLEPNKQVSVGGTVNSMVNISLNYNPEAKVVQLKVYNQFRDRSATQRKNEVVDAWKKSSLTQSNEE